ncbi:unnamed protein product [Oppiella nova]|uniref:C2H2-type domain-containing protein n=1 Tax=Oppiella nova TaxID=334625 RepID=A0A7R9LS91_9ACAR|nr:unnamed protein product [Oppiella nova]CAG2166474.1 unnamed protein product [Oppiella nova]
MVSDEHVIGSRDEIVCDKSQDIDCQQLIDKKSKIDDNLVDTKTDISSEPIEPVADNHKSLMSNGEYVCDHQNCSQRFSNIKALLLHKASRVHKSSDGRFVCDYEDCRKTFSKFSKKVHFVEHLYIHYGLIPFGGRCRCDQKGCSATFSTPKDLRQHELRKHESTYRCDREGCDFKTGRKSILNKHKSIHSTERLFKCSLNECDKWFKTRKDMTRHQHNLHPDAFPDIPWIHCSHTGCEFRTKFKQTMSAHIEHHLKEYLCHECGKGYANSGRLKEHQRSHDETMQYQCEWPGCAKRFTQKSSFIGHMDAHSAKAIYRCSWPGCEKAYFNVRSLESHIHTHKGIKNYRCEWPACDYATTRAKYLNLHMNKHVAKE